MRDLGLNGLPLQRSPGAASSPRARARVNEKGLDFYRRLVDALLEAGIEPVRRRSSTGTSRPRSTTAAAGSTATSRAGSPSTRSVVFARARRARRRVGDAERAVGRDATAATCYGVARARPPQPLRGADRAHNLLRAHGAAVAAYRADGSAARSASSSTSSRSIPATDSDADARRDARAPTPT